MDAHIRRAVQGMALYFAPYLLVPHALKFGSHWGRSLGLAIRALKAIH